MEIGVAIAVAIAFVSGAIAAGVLVRRTAIPDDAKQRARATGALQRPVPEEVRAFTKALEAGEEIFLPTGRTNEFLVMASTSLPEAGVPVPRDVARTVAGAISASLRAGFDAAQATGRLVTVDAQTAKAIRAGKLASDSTGKPLAIVRGSAGQFEHLARISPALGKAASLSLGAANLLGAASTQMQMASIEAKLGEIVEVSRRLERLADRELESSIHATSRLVEEVFGPSRHADRLPDESWAQLAPHFHTVLRDQEMAIGNVEDLIGRAGKDPSGFWLRTRSDGIRANRGELIERLALLHHADLNVLRLYVIRLWHYATHHPELAAEFAAQAQNELSAQESREANLLERAKAGIGSHGELGRIEAAFHWMEAGNFAERVNEMARIDPLPRRALVGGPDTIKPPPIAQAIEVDSDEES